MAMSAQENIPKYNNILTGCAVCLSLSHENFIGWTADIDS